MTGGEAYWTFEQALDYVIHRDVAKVRSTPSFFSLDDRSPEAREALEALWTPEAFEALWALFRGLETEIGHAIEHREPIDRLQWRDRQAHLRQHEELVETIGLRQFIAEVRKATCHTLILAADILAAFPANSPAKPKAVTVIPPAEPDAKATQPSTESNSAPTMSTTSDALSKTELGRRGGKKSGKVRRESRPWVPHAEEIVLTVDSNLSNGAIATEINGGWKRQDVDPPSIRTLEGFVGELRESGRLPPRQPQPKAPKAK